MPRILRTRGRKDKAKRTKLTRYGSDFPAVHGSVEYNSTCYYMSCHERVDRIPVERHRAAISPGVQRAYARQGDHGAAMAVDKLFEEPGRHKAGSARRVDRGRTAHPVAHGRTAQQKSVV